MIFDLASEPENQKFFASVLNAMRDDCEMKIEHFRGMLYINTFETSAGTRFDIARFEGNKPLKKYFDSAKEVIDFLFENGYSKFHLYISN